MAQTIKLKRSSVSGNIPLTTQLDLGEVAINTFDGKMYIKKDDGTEHIVEVGYNLGVVQEYIFTATASQTVFTGLDDNSIGFVYNPGNIQVFLNGVLLEKTVDFTETSSTTLTLSEPVDAADMLQVFSFNKKIGDGRIAVNTFTGDGSTTSFTLSVAPEDVNNLSVYIDGIYQSKSNYTVTGTTLDFGATPPPLDTAIEVEIATREVSIDTTTGLSFTDNVKAKFGNDDDLEIFHDGSNSIINDTGTGNVKFQVAGTDVAEVTVDGITVTGDVEADEFIGDLRGAVEFHAQAGEVLAKGDVVYISGISGNTTVVSKADADDPAKMPAFGIISIGGNQNANVEVVTFGTLSGVNTSTFTEGEEIFVSNTAGVYTNTAPTGETSALQKIGKITRADTNGSIKVIGAGRSNATPNLNDGNIFIGNASNQATTASLNTKIEDYLDAGSSTPNFTTANITTGTIGTLTVSTEATIPYDNSISGLTATNVQSAISELNNLLGGGNVGSQASFDSYEFTATTNQTTFDLANLGLSPTPSYIAGYIQVFLNGVLLAEADYTATDGQTIVLGAAADLNDIITVTILDSFDIANVLRVTSFDASAPQDNLVIDSTGNVGIGTTSPNADLTVTDGTSAGVLSIGNDNTQLSVRKLQFGEADDYSIQSNANSYLRFHTEGNEAMRIDSSGNVGIGVVPEAWNAAFTEVLQVGPASVVTSGGDNGRLFSNAYYDGAYKRIGTGYAHSYEQTGGTHRWYIATGGSAAADSTFTWDESMRIDSSGNVGIGTDTPDSRLSVESDQQLIARFASTLENSSIIGLRLQGKDPSESPVDTVFVDWFYDPENRKYGFGEGTTSGDLPINSGLSHADIIIDNGNIGIGTPSPSAKLDIFDNAAGNANSSAIELTNYDYGVGETGQSVSIEALVRNDGGGSSTTGKIVFGKDSDYSSAANRDGNIQFYTNRSNSVTEAMRIDSAGNVSIGAPVNNDADAQLHVYGLGQTTADLTDSGNMGATLRLSDVNTAAGSGGAIIFANQQGDVANSAGFAAIKGLLSNGSTNTQGHIAFSTRNSISDTALTERMRIDSSGNILHINDSPEYHFGTSSASHYNWRIAAQEVVDRGFEIASGTQSVGSGALSDTYTTRFTIKGDTGNVGIGTLNPDAPLDVHVIEDTYTNYRTQLRLGHTKTNGVDEGSSLTFTAAGDALGAVIYSNGRYDNDVLVQEDSIRPSGFIAFGNGLPNTGTGIIELGGLVAGTTTPVVNMRMESNGALNLLGAGLQVDGQTIIDTNGSIKSVGIETQLAKTYQLPQTGGSSQWVKLGTFVTAQQGRSIHFKFVARSGFNANNAQTQTSELRFGTSNNSSAGTALDSSQVQQTSVFFGDAQYYKYEDGNAGNAPNDIVIIQKSNSSYEFWGNFGSFTGEGSFFVVSHSTFDGFTYDGTQQTAFPTIGASEYYVQKSVIGIQNNVILANYGTGTYTATFGGLANMTGTAVLNEARYTRVGRNLTIEGRITGLSVTTGGTEAVVVMTLPTGGFYMDSNDSRATGSAWDSDRRIIGIVTNNSGGNNTDLAIVFPSYATSSGTTNIAFSITYFS